MASSGSSRATASRMRRVLPTPAAPEMTSPRDAAARAFSRTSASSSARPTSGQPMAIDRTTAKPSGARVVVEGLEGQELLVRDAQEDRDRAAIEVEPSTDLLDRQVLRGQLDR